MTELLKMAMAAITRLPEAEQNAIARRMLALVEDRTQIEPILAEDLDDVISGLADAMRGDFASDAEFRAVMTQFGSEQTA